MPIKKHSTETDVLSASIYKRLVSLVCILDLSAVYYIIDRNFLLARLQHSIGFDDTVFELFKPYVTDRTQTICIKSKISPLAPLFYDVHHGTVLRRVFFTFYTSISHISLHPSDAISINMHMTPNFLIKMVLALSSITKK